MTDPISGTDWTNEEVILCVDSYLDHLKHQILGQSFNKAALYRSIAATTGRSASSIEFKFQNISAVLNEFGFEWIAGLAPLGNYQRLLADVIGSRETDIRAIANQPLPSESAFNDLASFYVEAAPERATTKTQLPDYIEALVTKFDPVERDMRHRALGEAGEALVLAYEKRFLKSIERTDLSENVRWISKLDGDGAGFDILSYDDRGNEKHIEVKTTVGGNKTPFFVSRNEHSHSLRRPDEFRLMRLFDFRKAPRAFELNGPLDKFVRLSTETYRADFRA